SRSSPRLCAPFLSSRLTPKACLHGESVYEEDRKASTIPPPPAWQPTLGIAARLAPDLLRALQPAANLTAAAFPPGNPEQSSRCKRLIPQYLRSPSPLPALLARCLLFLTIVKQ